MRENILHFTWKYRSFTYSGLRNAQNEIVEIIDPGIENFDAGPDFFNAKLKIGNKVWAGNVEIHLKSSDWYAHGHHLDMQYDSVILHVVLINDKPTINSKRREIPTLVVGYPHDIENRYEQLVTSSAWVGCYSQLGKFDTLTIVSMLQRLMAERLEQKTQLILDEVSRCNGSWEEAFYRSISRCFGLKVNSNPAELMAKSLPLSLLGKHRNNLFQIEALLFGQSGLLNTVTCTDSYYVDLCKEYEFLQRKFNLTPIDASLWKFLRMRPIGFPTIRIAQLAALIHQSTSLFSKLLECQSYNQIETLLSCEPSEYWRTHYSFSKVSKEVAKPIGKSLIQIITLNSIIPFIFAYGISRANEPLKERALNLMESIPAEDNNVVNGFRALGVKVHSAADSQALIQLKTNWCDTKKCIFCDIGVKLLGGK